MARKAGSDDDPHAAPETRPNLSSETFLDACRQQAALNAERKALNEKISSARKVMKANGVELGIMDATLKMAEWERGEVREHFDRRRQYAEWLGLPVGTQPDLFKGMSDDDVQRNEWYAAGVTAKRAGKPRVAPDDCPDAYLLAWDAGYDGKDIKSAGTGSGMRASSAKPKPKAEPKPPGGGRKKKAGFLEEPPAQHTKESESAAQEQSFPEAVDGTGKRGEDADPDVVPGGKVVPMSSRAKH